MQTISERCGLNSRIILEACLCCCWTVLHHKEEPGLAYLITCQQRSKHFIYAFRFRKSWKKSKRAREDQWEDQVLHMLSCWLTALLTDALQPHTFVKWTAPSFSSVALVLIQSCFVSLFPPTPTHIHTHSNPENTHHTLISSVSHLSPDGWA